MKKRNNNIKDKIRCIMKMAKRKCYYPYRVYSTDICRVLNFKRCYKREVNQTQLTSQKCHILIENRFVCGRYEKCDLSIGLRRQAKTLANWAMSFMLSFFTSLLCWWIYNSLNIFNLLFPFSGEFVWLNLTKILHNPKNIVIIDTFELVATCFVSRLFCVLIWDQRNDSI